MKIHSYNWVKFKIFQHYWWILFLFAVVVILCISIVDKTIQNITLALTSLGGILSLFFLIQKQKLEELSLFKSLFTDFNKRYDNFNEKLNKLIDPKKAAKDLTEDEKNLLNDYFNLCAEEYLFYKKGYIYPEVWQAWENGMKYFLESEKVKNYWKDEKKSGSYYGLEIN